ncbi:c6 zinc finger domain-containing protein [Diaporthe amygdali]|uniref:c6 zinc finger domain-containing protein n=1 Tax=Phomopsis amygdali TaxID=1214568 RepID=UPI0022FE2FAE|nr:c6 zinc finger domain-containing protein [Diaporthe amygdali]KAJ0122725.1 c6 zinc finger domain-containing protein [Diaporthe amygdali]
MTQLGSPTDASHNHHRDTGATSPPDPFASLLDCWKTFILPEVASARPASPLACLPPPPPCSECMDGSAATGAGAASSAAQAQALHGHGQHGNGGPASSMSPTSPVSARSHGLSHASGIGANGAAKRKRSSVGMIGSSPGSADGDDDLAGDHHEKKRQPGVKRACNECRQQKLRCDVVQDPFTSCSRCVRLKLDCKIESNFKRVGKRSKHAEMEKEIEKLRRNVAKARSQGYIPDEDDPMESQLQSPVVASVYSHTRHPSLMGSDEAVSSLLHLKRGGSYNVPRICRELDEVRLTEEAESQLFTEYFAHYDQFLPFLNPAQSPDQYYAQHPLLYWVIISVAARRYHPDPSLLGNLSGPLTNLLWQTIGDVPSSHHVVKALCLLCTWPLPTSTSSSDPTQILCGVMMKVATLIGLHRPHHINDFSRVIIDLDNEQLHDRVMTWAVTNIVAQSIGTGYGQPASSLYDWTLAIRPGESGPFQLSPDLEARLQIERFCDKVSKEMYSNASDPRGVAGDEHRAMLMRVYRREFGELQASILSRNLSRVVNLHLRAAGLHLRLAGFFDSHNTPGYMDDLMGLWRASCSFLDYALDSKPTSPLDHHGESELLRYATNYIQQMLVAAGFALLKLLRSFFAKSVDYERGRILFHRTITAIRSTSVVQNDLNWRLAELMVQIWNGARAEKRSKSYHDEDSVHEIDDSLQLQVRCRHSMSLVYDSIWHWREEYQARGRGNLDYSAEHSSASSTHLDPPLSTAHGLPASLLAASNGALTPSGGSGFGSGQGGLGGSNYEPTNYDFFDPQHWMLDGLMDFNYSFVPEMGA